MNYYYYQQASHTSQTLAQFPPLPTPSPPDPSTANIQAQYEAMKEKHCKRDKLLANLMKGYADNNQMLQQLSTISTRNKNRTVQLLHSISAAEITILDVTMDKAGQKQQHKPPTLDQGSLEEACDH